MIRAVGREGLLWLVAWIAAAYVCVACHGCGAALSAYEVEHARCLTNEQAIVDRPGTTQEQDEIDMDIERARCSQALATIRRQ